MLADYHVHTDHSDDSLEPMEEVIKKAISIHIDELCFTDHVDYGPKYDVTGYFHMSRAEKAKIQLVANVDYPAYFQQIKDLSDKYQGQIVLKRGLEFGMQTHTIPQFQKLFDTYEMDFIILSCHQVGDKEFWNYKIQNEKTPDEYVVLYYQEIYECMKAYQDYSVLGHLDMVQRYTKPRYPFEKSREIIAEILKQAIRDGKGIEVNTSNFKYKLPDLTPERCILELYHDLGGKVITVGSDCHDKSRVGDRIPYIYDILKAIGFTYFCTFDKMEPIFHPL